MTTTSFHLYPSLLPLVLVGPDPSTTDSDAIQDAREQSDPHLDSLAAALQRPKQQTNHDIFLKSVLKIVPPSQIDRGEATKGGNCSSRLVAEDHNLNSSRNDATGCGWRLGCKSSPAGMSDEMARAGGCLCFVSSRVLQWCAERKSRNTINNPPPSPPPAIRRVNPAVSLVPLPFPYLVRPGLEDTSTSPPMPLCCGIIIRSGRLPAMASATLPPIE